MSRDDIYTGIDIGSSAIRVAVGQRDTDGKVRIISAAEVPSEGISRGVVSGIEDAVSSISSAVEQAERIGGVAIEHAAIGVSGTHISSQSCRGVVAVAKANREISEDDVERALESAQTAVNTANFEILHVLPHVFTVDNQGGISDPVGMSGLRLEVDAQIILGQQSQISNITKAIYRTGVDIDDMVLGVLAAAEATLSKRQKELGVALLSLGGATSSLLVMEEGDVLHTAIFPIGGSHITNDIAIGLRTSIDIAERAKIEVGSTLPGDISKKEEVDLAQFGANESEMVSLRYISEIIEARVDEIFRMVDKELQSIEKSGLLPAGIMLTGGGARIPGMQETAKETFRLPAEIGAPTQVATTIERVADPMFATVVGLVLWNAGVDRASAMWQTNKFSSVAEVTGKMKKWFRAIVP